MFSDIYRGEQLSATWLGRAAVQTLTSGGSDVAIEAFGRCKTGICLTSTSRSKARHPFHRDPLSRPSRKCRPVQS